MRMFVLMHFISYLFFLTSHLHPEAQECQAIVILQKLVHYFQVNNMSLMRYVKTRFVGDINFLWKNQTRVDGLLNVATKNVNDMHGQLGWEKLIALNYVVWIAVTHVAEIRYYLIIGKQVLELWGRFWGPNSF